MNGKGWCDNATDRCRDTATPRYANALVGRVRAIALGMGEESAIALGIGG